MIHITDEEMKMAADIFREHAADCSVMVFGSRLTGRHKSYSDLDLAFRMKNGGKLDSGKIMDIKYAFSESDIPYMVDVLDYNAVSDEFRKVIDKNNELIWRNQNDS